MNRAQQLLLQQPSTKKLLQHQYLQVNKGRNNIIVQHQATRAFAKVAKGSRGARGHGWLHHYRNGTGDHHLQGRWYNRDPEKLSDYNDEILTMPDKRITNCFMDIGIDSDVPVGRFEFELAYWALPKTCQRFMDFCNISDMEASDKKKRKNKNKSPLAGISYLNSNIHKIEKNIGVCGGEINTKGENLLVKQQASLLEPEGHILSHSSRGMLSMCISTKGMVDSRFIVTTANAPQLDGRFVAFGRMKDDGVGDQLLDDIVKVYNLKGRPSVDIQILNCGVIE